ncbi:outer membrane beta-barrel protein [Arsukibacterium sp.]|uniref:outer membrane beta-barrel protein n=1 Tax=Arsukibacterium sp. TaxID=1977258 RepID=UPI001BD43A96|nr:outer membrane beta-barrel protein [Arsukibacterium sp.]
MRNVVKKIALASVLTTAAFAGAAQAEMYFELGATQISADIESESISHFGATGVIGTTLQATEKFAHKVEALAIIGLNSDKLYGVDVKLQSLIGAAYRPTIKLNDSVELHARLGVFNGRVKASGFGMSESDSSTEAGFGVGIDFKKLSLSYLNVDDTNFVTATFRF